MRQDITFDAEGVELAAWYYRPEGVEGKTPAIVMAHGFSGVKEQYLDRYAERFVQRGFAVLVFDHRNFGASGGEPRGEIDPWVQVRDYRHAVTWLSLREEIDAERIGLWGTSYSGGHVLVVGAIDERVKCLVAQVPDIDGYEGLQRWIRPDILPMIRAQFNADRASRLQGNPPAMIPVVAEDPAAPCALPGQEAWSFFTESARFAPTWQNAITLRSVEMIMEYSPGDYIERIAPKPLLMIVGTQDGITPTDLALEAYNRAREPKELLLIEGGHFDPYLKEFERASTAAVEWFLKHLL